MWRHRNSNTQEFTWSNHNGSVQSRLDRIYISVDVIDLVRCAHITPSTYSDHCLMIVELKLPSIIEPGGGFWKLDFDYLQHQALNDRIVSF